MGIVTDLNGTGWGGIPAFLEYFTRQLRLRYAVSQEAVGGKSLTFTIRNVERW